MCAALNPAGDDHERCTALRSLLISRALLEPPLTLLGNASRLNTLASLRHYYALCQARHLGCCALVECSLSADKATLHFGPPPHGSPLPSFSSITARSLHLFPRLAQASSDALAAALGQKMLKRLVRALTRAEANTSGEGSQRLEYMRSLACACKATQLSHEVRALRQGSGSKSSGDDDDNDDDGDDDGGGAGHPADGHDGRYGDGDDEEESAVDEGSSDGAPEPADARHSGGQEEDLSAAFEAVVLAPSSQARSPVRSPPFGGLVAGGLVARPAEGGDDTQTLPPSPVCSPSRLLVQPPGAHRMSSAEFDPEATLAPDTDYWRSSQAEVSPGAAGGGVARYSPLAWHVARLDGESAPSSDPIEEALTPECATSSPVQQGAALAPAPAEERADEEWRARGGAGGEAQPRHPAAGAVPKAPDGQTKKRKAIAPETFAPRPHAGPSAAAPVAAPEERVLGSAARAPPRVYCCKKCGKPKKGHKCSAV